MNIISEMKDSGWQNLAPVNYNMDKILKIQSKYNKENSLMDLIQETRDVIIAFNLGMESKEARKEALNIIKPVTYKQAKNFIDNVDRIINKNIDYLTFPKTSAGIQKAYENTIKNGSIEDVAFLFGMDENYTISIYHSMLLKKEIDGKKSMGASFLQEITDKMFEQKIDKKIEKNSEIDRQNLNDKKETISQDNTNNTQVKKSEGPAVFFKKDPAIHKEIDKIVEDIESILKPIREDFNSYQKNKDFASFQIGKVIDSATRKYNFEHGELNSWFTDILLESQYNILYKNVEDSTNTFFSRLYLEMIVDCSSELTELGLDTQTVFEDKKFWYGLKVVRENVAPVDYKIFTNCLVSNFLTLKTYSDSEKIDIGMNAMSMVIKDELNFKSRLNLWLDIGGGLTLEDSKGQTIIDKLKIKNNPMWNKSIVEIAKERDINLHKFYPKDFNRPGDFIPTKEDIINSRKNNVPF